MSPSSAVCGEKLNKYFDSVSLFGSSRHRDIDLYQHQLLLLLPSETLIVNCETVLSHFAAAAFHTSYKVLCLNGSLIIAARVKTIETFIFSVKLFFSIMSKNFT